MFCFAPNFTYLDRLRGSNLDQESPVLSMIQARMYHEPNHLIKRDLKSVLTLRSKLLLISKLNVYNFLCKSGRLKIKHRFAAMWEILLYVLAGGHLHSNSHINYGWIAVILRFALREAFKLLWLRGFQMSWCSSINKTKLPTNGVSYKK